MSPRYLIGMLFVKQCVRSGFAGHLLPPCLFSDLCRGQLPALLLVIYFTRNAAPLPAGTAVIYWLVNLLLLFEGFLLLQPWRKCRQKHGCAQTVGVPVGNMSLGHSWIPPAVCGVARTSLILKILSSGSIAPSSRTWSTA